MPRKDGIKYVQGKKDLNKIHIKTVRGNVLSCKRTDKTFVKGLIKCTRTRKGVHRRALRNYNYIQEEHRKMSMKFNRMYNENDDSSKSLIAKDIKIQALKELNSVNLDLLEQQAKELVLKEKKIKELEEEIQNLRSRIEHLERRDSTTLNRKQSTDEPLSIETSLAEVALPADETKPKDIENSVTKGVSIKNSSNVNKSQKSPIIEIDEKHKKDSRKFSPRQVSSVQIPLESPTLRSSPREKRKKIEDNDKPSEKVISELSVKKLKISTICVQGDAKVLQLKSPTHSETKFTHIKSNLPSDTKVSHINIYAPNDAEVEKVKSPLQDAKSPSHRTYPPTKIYQIKTSTPTDKSSPFIKTFIPTDIKVAPIKSPINVTPIRSPTPNDTRDVTDHSLRSREKRDIKLDETIDTNIKDPPKSSINIYTPDENTPRPSSSLTPEPRVLSRHRAEPLSPQVETMLSTKFPYYILNSSPANLPIDLYEELFEEKVEIPKWRFRTLSALYVMEGTENLEDEIFLKRHSKPEIDERRRKRWDLQRMREQRQYEKLRERYEERNKAGNGRRSIRCTLWPNPQLATSITITDNLPVCAFGQTLPNLVESCFSIPWLPKSGSLSRRKHR